MISRLLLGIYSGLIILILPAFSQSVFRGVVRDSLTGASLPGVNVVVGGTFLGATTNARGLYVIVNVPLGTQTVICRLVSYLPASRRVTLLSDTVVTLNFRLQPAPVELEEVEVVGEPAEWADPKAMALKTITGSEILAFPVALQKDIFRALQFLPGIGRVGDVASRFYVRGGRGDQNLILLNGMPIYNPFDALGLYSIFDPEIVRNVKVYTSNYPAEYGQRLSSVIEVITKTGNRNRVQGRTNVNLLSASVMVEGPLLHRSS